MLDEIGYKFLDTFFTALAPESPDLLNECVKSAVFKPDNEAVYSKIQAYFPNDAPHVYYSRFALQGITGLMSAISFYDTIEALSNIGKEIDTISLAF